MVEILTDMLFDETYCFVIVVHNVCKFSIQLENRAKLKMTEPAILNQCSVEQTSSLSHKFL